MSRGTVDGMEPCELVREVDGHVHTLAIDVHHYGGWKVRIVGYGVGPEPNIFELVPGGRSEAAAEKLAPKLIAKLRREGWADELSAKAQAAVAARKAAETGAADAKRHAYAAKVEKFPATALDRVLAAAIAKPAKVIRLDLRGTGRDRLSVIPPTIARLTNLEVLDLTGNALTELPDELAKLEKLRVLRLAFNQLVELPRMVWHLKKLEVLDLHGNRLAAIFKHFGYHQKKGAELQVGGNPLGRGVVIGTWPKLGTVGVDTTALFPIDRDYLDEEFSGQKTFPLAALHLYGRGPTRAEHAVVTKLFPKAVIQHVDRVEDGPILGSAPAPSKPLTPVKRGKPGKPHPEQVAHQAALIKKTPKRAAAIRERGRPAIELVTRAATKRDLAPGATRIGGVPDLATGAAWPASGRGPMVFVAQLDLAAIAPYDPEHLLPATGLLSFFAGNYDEGVVVHTEGAVAPAKPPKQLKFGAGKEPPYPVCGVKLRGVTSVPAPLAAWHPCHRVLGHGFGDAQGLGEDERVLLAVESDDRAKMMWGDAGRLYFVIDDDALSRRAWDEVRVTSTD